MTASIVILASGGGRTVENLHRYLSSNTLDARITKIFSSSPSAGVISRSENLGIDAAVVSEDIVDDIRGESPDWILLAGWLRLLPIPPDFEGRVLNIHPSLLPAWGGKGFWGQHVHDAVAASGSAQVSGCSVHFASAEYDRGPIILQEATLLPPMADSATIATAVFEAEKRAYPEALRLLLTGRVRWKDGSAVWA